MVGLLLIKGSHCDTSLLEMSDCHFHLDGAQGPVIEQIDVVHCEIVDVCNLHGGQLAIRPRGDSICAL